jgi:hypothetical protein
MDGGELITLLTNRRGREACCFPPPFSLLLFICKGGLL